METLVTGILGLLLVCSIALTVWILFKIALKIVLFIVGCVALLLICIGLVMMVNLLNDGTPFSNGMSFSQGVHYIATNNVPKEIKAVKNDLSVTEIKAPNQIEGAKEVKK